MRTIRVKLKKKAVRDYILLDNGTENYLEEVAGKIKSDFDVLTTNPANSRIEVQENRRNRAAVDIIVDRTSEVVENHLLEKAVEAQ